MSQNRTELPNRSIVLSCPNGHGEMKEIKHEYFAGGYRREYRCSECLTKGRALIEAVNP